MSVASQYIDDLFAGRLRVSRPEQEVSYLIWLRNVALVEQRGKCFYCSLDLEKSKATADHVVPRSLGGKTQQGNIVASCRECNSRKGSSDATVFKAERFPKVIREIGPSEI